jgi:exopolysaccharide production protein ExoZ
LIFYFSGRINIDSKFGYVLIGVSVAMIFLINLYDFELPRVLKYGLSAALFFIGMLLMEPIFRAYKLKSFFMALKGVGDSSYSLYLFHPFSLGLFSIILSRLGVNDFGGIFVVLLVVTSLVSGHLCYLVIEVPIARFFKNNKQYIVRKSKLSINQT